MSKKPNGKDQTDDWVHAGFRRLDAKPPQGRHKRIKWGLLYRNKTDQQKIEYLEKLAAEMNHAAFIIQNERDTFGQLCEAKEKQIGSLKKAVAQNNAMIQGEITRMNAERQQYNAEIKRLRVELRALRPEAKSVIPATRMPEEKPADGDHD